jgi:ATP-dependent helicase/nuclease subunit A
LVLQYIDWTRPCIGDDLNRQIQSMLDRKLISLTQAALVDRAAIEWFISTDLAATLRQPGVDLRRELPFYLTCPSAQFDAPPSADPLDQVMVRGRMDLVVISQTSLSIVDYKTDRVTRDQVPARAALYEGQMKLYRQALSAIIDRPMEAMHLVFLTPRAIHILR